MGLLRCPRMLATQHTLVHDWPPSMSVVAEWSVSANQNVKAPSLLLVLCHLLEVISQIQLHQLLSPLCKSSGALIRSWLSESTFLPSIGTFHSPSTSVFCSHFLPRRIAITST